MSVRLDPPRHIFSHILGSIGVQICDLDFDIYLELDHDLDLEYEFFLNYKLFHDIYLEFYLNLNLTKSSIFPLDFLF